MLDRIPERLRTAAAGVEMATKMMADAKSARNQAAGDKDARYMGLRKEDTAEWQAADLIERLQKALAHTRNRIEALLDEKDVDDDGILGEIDVAIANASSENNPI